MKAIPDPVIEIDLPGTPQHRAVLKAICDLYRDDNRILALIVFGSLGRGNWDAISDIDLDIVIFDEIQIDIETELQRLGEALVGAGEKTVLMIPDVDEGEVLLESLLQLSIRYHPLDNTSPNITSSMRILAGDLERAAIEAAGEANRKPDRTSLELLVERCLREAASASVYLLRGQSWLTIELLHRIRSLLLEIFARTHAGERSLHAFQAGADPILQLRLGETLPSLDQISIGESYLKLLDLLENGLPEISNGQTSLNEAERRAIQRMRSRIRDKQQSKAGGRKTK